MEEKSRVGVSEEVVAVVRASLPASASRTAGGTTRFEAPPSARCHAFREIWLGGTVPASAEPRDDWPTRG